MSDLLWRVRIEVRHGLIMAGYWVRPYDMLLDRRRWRWQPAGLCGYRMFG